MIAAFFNLLLVSFVAALTIALLYIALLGLFSSEIRLKNWFSKALVKVLIVDMWLIATFLIGYTLDWWGMEGWLGAWLRPQLLLNTNSLAYFVTAVFISTIFFHFCANYLHQDRWYGKYKLNGIIFISSILVASLTDKISVFLVAWEFVGITSVFLIAFYQERQSTVKNAFRTLVSYKLGDACLYIAAIQLYGIGITSFSELASAQVPEYIYFLILVAVMVKSAQYPFCYWLPRAMEGPTPTSAVFYGSMAVHLAIFLALRVIPVHCMGLNIAMVSIGIVSLMHSSFVGRAIPDVKKSYAYATISQLAFMFIEIGLGYKSLALVHMCSHAILRFYQFLQTPSVLHRRHLLEGHIHRELHHGDGMLETVVPKFINQFLFFFSFKEGRLHHLRKALFVYPIRLISSTLEKFYSPVFFLIESIFPRGLFLFLMLLPTFIMLPLSHRVSIELIPLAIWSLLFFGLTLAISLLAERVLSRFFLKVIIVNIMSFAPGLLVHFKLGVLLLWAAHLILILFLYWTLQEIMGGHSKKQIIVQRFQGRFEANPMAGRWVIALLLLVSGTPMTPLFYLMESFGEFYFEHSWLNGIVFIILNIFFIVAIYRLIFRCLFGAPPSLSRVRPESVIYIKDQYQKSKRSV